MNRVEAAHKFSTVIAAAGGLHGRSRKYHHHGGDASIPRCPSHEAKHGLDVLLLGHWRAELAST